MRRQISSDEEVGIGTLQLLELPPIRVSANLGLLKTAKLGSAWPSNGILDACAGG